MWAKTVRDLSRLRIPESANATGILPEMGLKDTLSISEATHSSFVFCVLSQIADAKTSIVKKKVMPVLVVPIFHEDQGIVLPCRPGIS